MSDAGWRDKLLFTSVRPVSSGYGPVDDLSAPPLLLTLSGEKHLPLLAIFPTLAAAESACNAFRHWTAAANRNLSVLLLPDGTRDLHSASGTDCSRAEALYQLLQDPPDVLFASVPAVLNPVPSAKEMRKRSFTIRRGDTLEVTAHTLHT